MGEWVVWLVLAGVLLLAEVFTLTFVLGLLSIAAVVAAAAAALDVPVAAQVAAFGVSSGLLFVLVRPLERRHNQAPAIRTGTAALAGRTAVVIEAITDHAGRVKLGGESWAARSIAPGTIVPAGASVVVTKVEGATLVVYPEEL
ncbi:MAG: NfeD family protein [Frankiales bacterium]|nr:NfeD family protein [Frankiales bacterium]